MRNGLRNAFITAGLVLPALAAPDSRLLSHAVAAALDKPLLLAQAPQPAPTNPNDPRLKKKPPPKPGQPAQPARPPGPPQQVKPPQQPAVVPPRVPPRQPAQPVQPPKPQQPAVAPSRVPPQQPAQPAQPPKPQQPAVAPSRVPPQQPAQPVQPPRLQQPAVAPQPVKPAQPAQPVQPPQQPATAPPRIQPAQPQPPAVAPAPVRPAQPAPAVQPQTPSAAQQAPRPGFDRGGPRNIEELRGQRSRREEGGRRIIEEPDRRVIVRDQNRAIIRHDETSRFRRFGGDPRVVQQGSETRTVFARPGGVQVITVTDPNGRFVRRIRRDPNGREVVLIDNRLRGAAAVGAVGAAALAAGFFLTLPPPRIAIPREQYYVGYGHAAPPDIYAALEAPPLEPPERAYALDEIRYNYNLRARMRRIVIDTINFELGSWELSPDQIGRLEYIADAIRRIISRNPNEVFLIEGHTDAVGPDEDNLSLSDRRAETIAAILTEHFQIPPENLVTQGYGEQHLLVPTPGPEPANRRAEVIRITPLLAGRP
jgi:outer membrane protein OmpA-like peptidoglycan-associated protein